MLHTKEISCCTVGIFSFRGKKMKFALVFLRVMLRKCESQGSLNLYILSLSLLTKKDIYILFISIASK